MEKTSLNLSLGTRHLRIPPQAPTSSNSIFLHRNNINHIYPPPSNIQYPTLLVTMTNYPQRHHQQPTLRHPAQLAHPSKTARPKSRAHADIRQTKEYKIAARRYVHVHAPSPTSNQTPKILSISLLCERRSISLQNVQPAKPPSHSRWTSTIVALPIVLYTSYILYERSEFSFLLFLPTDWPLDIYLSPKVVYG